jgi:hypothetical protein
MYVGPAVGLPQDEKPLLVNVCDLKKDPEAYNHKLVQVQGKVSHEFEDFSVHDAGCPDFKNTLWLMYGGNTPNDVTYCCGVTVGSKNQVNIEGIDVPLRQDPPLERFRRLLSPYPFDKKAKVHHCESNPSFSVTATIIGRFFAGKQGRGFAIWDARKIAPLAFSEKRSNYSPPTPIIQVGSFIRVS